MQSQSSDTFPSHTGNDQISFYDPAFYYTRPFFINDSESNPTSKQENNNNHRDLHSFPPSLSFSHFPSPPFEDTETFLEQHHDFLLQFHHHQPLPQDPEPQILPPCITTIGPSSCTKKGDNQIQRKRLGKRDRHSKIKTARGLRDRRMRLSLEVAKRFFGLQDVLGFDKASKTVEWLLNQAKVEINRLVKGKKKQEKKNKENDHHHHHSCSSASSPECDEEGVSSLDEVVVSGDQEQEQERVEKVVKRRVRHCRKISGFHPLAKECRERARERARERTREKMRNRSGVLVEESKQCREEVIQLGFWNPFETREEFANHTVLHPSSSLDVITTEAKEQSNHHAKEHGDDDDDDDSLVNYFEQMEPLLDFQ